MKILVAILLALLLLTGSAYLYNRHIQKQQDAVAAFAFREVEKAYVTCVKQPSDPNAGCLKGTEEMRQYMKAHNATASETAKVAIDCITANGNREFERLDACENVHQTAIQEWAAKYPRQAAQRQANMLNEKRRRDEVNMKKQQQ